MLISVLLLLAGVFLLWGSAEALVSGAVYLGRRAGISPVAIGLTVVSIGTSAPEFVVCVAAALGGSADIAVGNVLGSNLANIGLILGIAVLIRPIQVAGQVVFRELPWMLGVSILAFPLLLNLEMGRVEGAVLASALFAYLYFLSRVARRAPGEVFGSEMVEFADGAKAAGEPSGGGGTPEEEQDPGAGRSSESGALRDYFGPVLFVFGGSIGLVLGGQSIVAGGTRFADLLGIPEMIVGLSIVALGTSMPELATSVVAALRDEGDLAVGNIVGSNIFNLTFVLGGTALAQPFAIRPSVLRVEYPAMLLVSLALIPLLWRDHRLGRFEGSCLLVLYAGAWVWILAAGG